MSRDTKPSPCTSASVRSAGSRRGSTLAMAVSTVKPAPHPAARLRTPKLTPARVAATAACSGPSTSDRPSTALAITSVNPCSRPSSRRRSCRLAGSASGLNTTKTSSFSSSTLWARTSSAKGSRVPPETRSKRAWCQWQVKSPFSTVPRWSGKPMCGQRSSTAYASPSLKKTHTGVEPTLPVRHPLALSSWNFPTRLRRALSVASSSRVRCTGTSSLRLAIAAPATVDTVRHEVWLRSRVLAVRGATFCVAGGLNGSMDERELGADGPRTHATTRHRNQSNATATATAQPARQTAAPEDSGGRAPHW